VFARERETPLTNDNLRKTIPLLSIRFAYDPVRASHAARWLLASHGGRLDRLKLFKLIFLADRLHLARYGRPIVGGRYYAMEHGPVASEFYSAIKDNSLDGALPEEGSYRVEAVRKADEDCLSESDLEILKEINDRYGSWDAWRLRDLTHTYEAWKKNYKGNNSSYPLPYEDFFADLSSDDRGMLELIAETQEAERALG
jgi:uncharacterized phage-associated protein